MANKLALQLPDFGPVPFSAFESLAGLVPVIANGVRAGKAATDIEADVVKALPSEALSIAEALLSVFFPGAGTILALIVWVVENQKPMSQQDQIDWMNATTAMLNDSRNGSG